MCFPELRVWPSCCVVFCTASDPGPTGGFACRLGWRLDDNKHHWCRMHGNKWQSQRSKESGLSGPDHGLGTWYFLLVTQIALSSVATNRSAHSLGSSYLFVVTAEPRRPNWQCRTGKYRQAGQVLCYHLFSAQSGSVSSAPNLIRLHFAYLNIP